MMAAPGGKQPPTGFRARSIDPKLASHRYPDRDGGGPAGAIGSSRNLLLRNRRTLMAFFEIRQYPILPGKMDEWIEFMQTKIIPFQVSKGMVITGSFQGEEDKSVYFWIRRFESEADRVKLYEAVYQSDYWKNDIAPNVPTLINRDGIVVHRVEATSLSTMQ
jgi:hypothetical protein